MDDAGRIAVLISMLEELYEREGKNLLFHGWHHVSFVRGKAIFFAKTLGADLFFVESAALTHDLNYLVELNSEPGVGQTLRRNILTKCGYSTEEIERVEKIIEEAHIAVRGRTISNEGKALSDADSLFKILPITPILFSGRYIQENQIDIKKLADKIVSEQNSLLTEGIYFYTNVAKEKYLAWAKINLALWNAVEGSLEDEDVLRMLDVAGKSSKRR